MIEQAEFAAVRKSGYGSRSLRRRNPCRLDLVHRTFAHNVAILGAQLAPVAGRFSGMGTPHADDGDCSRRFCISLRSSLAGACGRYAGEGYEGSKSGRRARMPALGSVELLLVQLLRSGPLLSARDALLVGLLTPQIPKAAVASSPARRRLSPLDLESLGVNANLYRPRVSFIRCRLSRRGHSLAAEFCSTDHEPACDAATPGYM